MKHPVVGFTLVLGLCLTLLSSTLGAENAGLGSLNPSLMSAEGLEAKIARTETSTDLDAEVKTKIVARYREALNNLKEADVNRERAAAFEEVAQAAPEETRRILERIQQLGAAGPAQGLDVGPQTSRSEIALRLRKAQADLSAAEARRADFKRQRTFHENRPTMIRQRLTAAQEQQEGIAAGLSAEFGIEHAGLASGPGSSLVQARWWALETRYVALSTEILALEQELISQPMRLDLLAARYDEEDATVARLRTRVETLKALLNDKRESEAALAKADAARMLELTEGGDPLLSRLARENAERTEHLSSIAARLDEHDEDEAQALRLAERIQANFEHVKAAREVSGLTEGIGPLLLEHRADLPDFEVYTRKLRALDRQIAEVNVSRLRHLDEATRIADPNRTLAELAAQLSADSRPQDLDTLRTLIVARQVLLDKQLEAEGVQLDALRSLRTAESRMLDVARDYDYFLREHLFWVGTGGKTRPADLANLQPEIARLFSHSVWSEYARSLRGQLATSSPYWFALLFSGILLWKRRALIAAIERASARTEYPSLGSLGQTLRALMLTLMLAAPLPLLFGATGWALQTAAQGTELSDKAGVQLVRIAVVLYVLLLLRGICLPRGIAIGHFRWPQAGARRLRSEIGWLIWVLIPAMLILGKAISVNPHAPLGPIGRLTALISGAAIALFFFRVFYPGKGLMTASRQGQSARLVSRAYPLWYPVLVAVPLVILVLFSEGYAYSALVLWDAYLLTLGLSVVLLLLHALTSSWLMRAQARLASRVARERRQAAVAERDALAGAELLAAPSDYAHVDLAAVSAAGRELLGMAVVALALVGLYAIWSPVFPALGILDEVTLWHTTGILDGEETALPVTLADLGLALVYLVAIGALAKRLPAMLEIILSERLHMTSSSRYTVTTLTNYLVVALGIVLALDAAGAQWSQLQWLVAAVGLGIGFGLQEIVANFVSGLIILFERPVRVGDVITVDGTDGVVTKIRIRATTIRGYDRKELLVPNKELITGRLLNWSLSDPVTRIMILVGVAYDTDVDLAHALMLEAAQENPRVLANPKPAMNLEGFGDNALTLSLRAYIEDIENRVAITSELNMAINRKFRDAGIAIAYPQRDLHLDTRGPLRVRLEEDGPTQPHDAEGEGPAGR
ncbi:mechanosensitive ion channel domain-containing protein [Thiocapsa sp.]|uniref:mechanosensitive ion channel domain-containing protein n=1 Tax=Thiocapsa sp. TaxID=2024551 RepID=UPI002C0DF899|nr:mechanosensitive ion channel domain-containing protein [Thiocapsa sp.]HSO82105.1 mechanosensitive ion channel domain-containing protein [Thiocapsa sp.]